MRGQTRQKSRLGDVSCRVVCLPGDYLQRSTNSKPIYSSCITPGWAAEESLCTAPNVGEGASWRSRIIIAT